MSVFSSFGSLSLDDRKIIVGIDFGTTFSGLAWAERRRVDHISVIDSWPSSLTSAEGASDAKVPTALRYTGKGIEWGFQIPPLVERHEWFKLRLMGGSPRIAIPSGPSRTSEQLTTDYLTVLIKHLKYTLEQKLGSGILRSVPLEFVLTVPAIWSEVAKQKTLNACQKAGLDTKTSVTLVSEPEAAAIYTLHSLDPHGLEIGDSFVLCDAGGGTVDLISYTITGLYPRLQVKEAAEGTGGYCGSTYLDENFSKYLTGKLSKDPDWDSEVLAEAMAQFNTIKRQYLPSSSTAEGYSISVPGLANNERLGIRRNRMKIKATEMEGIFEPVIKDVIALVKGQIKATNKKIRAVLLVGGFGQNNYLKERLRSTLGSSIEVRQPPHAWTAVVRGAVMMGLASQNAQSAVVQLTSRVARKHYGIRMIVPYEKGKHSWSERYWEDSEQEFYVHTMRWFIEKSEAMQESVPVVIKFHRDFKVSNGPPKTWSKTIFHDSDTPTAPVHKNGNVKKFANLEADLSQIPRSEMQQLIEVLPDGNRYYRIDGAVEATYYSASMKYVLLVRGIRYDVISVEYV